MEVVVDQASTYPMSYVSGTTSTGELYSTTIELPAGTHSFGFFASDGTDDWAWPKPPGLYHGLTVTSARERPRNSKIIYSPVNQAHYGFDMG